MKQSVWPDPALVECLHAGVAVVHLSDQLQVPLICQLQVGLHLVPLPAGLLCQHPDNRCDSLGSKFQVCCLYICQETSANTYITSENICSHLYLSWSEVKTENTCESFLISRWHEQISTRSCLVTRWIPQSRSSPAGGALQVNNTVHNKTQSMKTLPSTHTHTVFNCHMQLVCSAVHILLAI